MTTRGVLVLLSCIIVPATAASARVWQAPAEEPALAAPPGRTSPKATPSADKAARKRASDGVPARAPHADEAATPPQANETGKAAAPAPDAAPALAPPPPPAPPAAGPAAPPPAAAPLPAPAVAPPPLIEPMAAPAASSAPEDTAEIKLREIEERVNQLKEKVFQSKARLVQLQEVVLQGTVAGAKLVLTHKNEMGSSFKLTRMQYSLDGAVIFKRGDDQSEDLDKREDIEVFAGPVPPGNHQLSVYLEYTGNGFGVFNYLEGYSFKIKSSHAFIAEPGRVTNVHIVGYEKGGITTELQNRPSVRYDVEASEGLHPDAAKKGAAAEGKSMAPAPSSLPAPLSSPPGSASAPKPPP